MDRRTRWLVFLESLLGNFLFSICMLYGVSMTGAASAGLVMAAIPAVVAVLSQIFLKERIDLHTGVGIVLSVLGIAFYMLSKQEPVSELMPGPQGNLSTKNSPWGYALLAAAVVCEASYAVIGKRLSGSIGPKRIAALINLWGFALMTPFGLWLALSFNFGAVSASLWLLLLAYGLAASVWTVWLWMTGLKTIAAAQAGVFTVMLPLSAALTGVLALGETLGTMQLLAFGIALTGVVLATVSPRGNAREDHRKEKTTNAL
jgi:drug/metabolite transporter (DMT)-like permease